MEQHVKRGSIVKSMDGTNIAAIVWDYHIELPEWIIVLWLIAIVAIVYLALKSK